MSSPFFRFAATLAACCALHCGAARADDAADIDRLFRSGKTAEAFTQLDRLLAAKPHDPELLFLKGVMLSDSQRRGEALDVFIQLSTDHPELPEPYNNLAVLYASRGDYDKAEAALQSALRAQPDYALARQNLGDVYVELARQAYARVLKLEPSNAAVSAKLASLRGLAPPSAAASSASAKILKP